MIESTPLAPRLSSVQRLWLLELGLDRPMLARLTPAASKTAVPAGPASTPADSPDASDAREAGPAAPQGPAQASAALAALQRMGEPGKAHASRPTPANAGAATGETAAPSVKIQPVALEGVPADWAALEAKIQTCEVCELHAGRQRAVAGAGAVEAVDWLVVGEAPGERDDRFGQPFQGKAGELLHAMLHAAGIDPAQAVFYTNLVKCRPRSNRLPTPAEIAACLPHLHSQIALLRPRGILALGRLAAEALLVQGQLDGKAFEALRGRVHGFQAQTGDAIPLVVTYHPASLLSRPRHKAASWRDLNLARTLQAR